MQRGNVLNLFHSITLQFVQDLFQYEPYQLAFFKRIKLFQLTTDPKLSFISYSRYSKEKVTDLNICLRNTH